MPGFHIEQEILNIKQNAAVVKEVTRTSQNNFPASRGLSRRGKLKRQERDLCRLPTSFLSRMLSRFLNNQWHFSHMWHNPENRFKFEREHERLLNLSALSNFKWTNQSWRWNDLASGRCRGTHYKSLRKAEEANFKANFSFFTSLSTNEAHVFRVKFTGLYGTAGFIAIRDFSFWGESDLRSDVWPAMDGVVSLLTVLSRRGKNERFAVASRIHWIARLMADWLIPSKLFTLNVSCECSQNQTIL